MDKTKKQFLRMDLMLILVNIILFVNVSVIFTKYVKSNMNDIRDISVQRVENDSAEISNQLYRYMLQRQDVVEGIVLYIKEAALNLEESILFLRYTDVEDGTIALIDCQTGNGYKIKNETETDYTDYGNNSEIKKACENAFLENSEEKKIKVTEVFVEEKTGKEQVAFYQPIVIEDRQMLLLCVMSISDIVDNSLNDTVLGMRQGVLLNASGDVLNGKEQLDEIELENKNYFFYLKQKFDNVTGIAEKISSKDSGNFILLDKNGMEWVYGFAKIRETDGWVYVYREQHLGGELSANSKRAAFELFTLMAAIGVADVIFVFLQNLKLRKTIGELEKANKEKNNFISNMSHEIRTPINAVLGMDEMIIRESNEADIVGYAYDIKSAGKTLLGIINDILDFSKIESGKMEIIPTEYEVGSVANDLLNMIDSRVQAKGLQFNANINPRLPHLLYGDELRIKQIILNILTNAVKYTEKGSVTFTMDYEKLDDTKIMLKVSVKDTGIGMKQEEMDKLYKPFERLDEKRNRTIEGTGLGMSIVTSLLQQMGSRLEVHSVYGEGSEFAFQLVQGVAEWSELGDLERVYVEAKDSEKKKIGLLKAPKARILVVDDTPVNLTVVKGLLKRTDIQVDTAESGRECLELAAKNKYDVILLDHRMPEMDGIETLHELQRLEGASKGVPTIALTANAISGAYETYIKEGFCDYLAKPVSGNKLERMLMKYIPDELIEEVKASASLPEKVEEMIEIVSEKLQMLDKEADLKLEVRMGIQACGAEDTYCDVLEDFVVTAKKRQQEIQECYDKGDLQNYMIKVHALKSTARLAGAMELSEMAKYLEQCANDGNLEEIETKTQDLLTNYQDIGIKLLELLKVNEATEKEEMGEKQVRKAFLAIREFNEVFDFDNVDMVMETLSKYQVPQGALESYEALKGAVLDVDQENIRKIIDAYLGGTRSE